jgi:hypothetical protein
MIEDAGKQPSIPNFDSTTEREFSTEYRRVLDEMTSGDDYFASRLPAVCKSLFHRVVFTAMTHQMGSQFNTGIVITGYGRDELFPQLFEISVDGGFLNKVRHYEVQHLDVGKDGAKITPFAQDDIVNSFINGIDRYAINRRKQKHCYKTFSRGRSGLLRLSKS